jgi:short-subunit dehydrogenase
MEQNPVAIVTGAGSGIGQAVSVQLVQAGYAVALVGRDRSKLEQTSHQIRAVRRDAQILLIAADVGEANGPQRIIQQVLASYERIDVLINNAAIGHSAPPAKWKRDSLEEVFAINTFGPAMLIALVWPTMSKQKSGCIVNVSSMAAVDPFPGLGIYAASKSALESLARTIRNESLQHGIRAYNVAPGAVETPMLRGLFSKADLPESKTLRPETIAAVIMSCVRGERSEASGSTIILPSP